MPDLKMTATLIDKVTGSAKSIEKSITAVNKAAANPQGAQATGSIAKLGQFYQKLSAPLKDTEANLKKMGISGAFLRKEIGAMSTVVGNFAPRIGGLTSSMGALALGTGSVIGAMGAFGAAIVGATVTAKNFADSMRELNYASKKTDIPVDTLKAYTIAGRHFGATTDEMVSSLENFADAAVRYKYNAGNMREAMAAQHIPAQYFSKMLEDMTKDPRNTTKQYMDLLEVFGKIRKEFPGARGESMIGDIGKFFGQSGVVLRLDETEMKKQLDKVNKEYDFAALNKANALTGPLLTQWERAEVIFENWANTFEKQILPDVTNLLGEFNSTASTILDILNYLDRMDDKLKGMIPDWLKGSYWHDKIFGPGTGFLGTGAPTGGLTLGPSGGGAAPSGSGVGAGGGNPIASGVGSDAWRATRGMGPSGGAAPAIVPGIKTEMLTPGGGLATPSPRGAAPGTAPITLGDVHSALTGVAPGSSAYLKAQRASMAAEVRADPALAAELRGVAMAEDSHDPEGVVESMANRSAYLDSIGRHQSVHQLLHGGFYGPVNRGAVRPNNDPRMQAGIDRVWGGENRLRGATDQGMQGDPNAGWMGGRIHPPGATPGAIYNDWGGPGGHAGTARFREEQQRQVNDSAAVAGVLQHNVTGSGEIKVDVNAPAGTNVSGRSGGLFKRIAINRNVQMHPANSGPPDVAGNQ